MYRTVTFGPSLSAIAGVSSQNTHFALIPTSSSSYGETRMPIRLLLLGIALACSGNVHCETALLPAISIVAAPIIEFTQLDSFSGTSAVITEAQLRDQNAVDLASALRRTPGVQISRFNPVGSFGGDEGGAVFIRGMGASRPGSEIKTYIDGVPFFMGVWNHPLLDLLPLNGMRSITVNKSPQPAISGNNFASIELATKRAQAEGSQGSARISAGSFGTLIEQLDLVGRSGNLDFMLAQGYARSNGHRPNADGELKNIMGRVGFAIDPHWSLSATFLHTDNKASDPGDNTLPAPAVAPTFDTQGSMLAASISHKHGDWHGDLRIYSNKADSDWLNQPGDTITRSRLSGLRWREEMAPWQGGNLVLGVDHDRIKGEVDFGFTRFAGHTFRITSPYLALSQDLPLSKDWTLVPSLGVRAYSHSEFASRTAPHAGISLMSEHVTLYANAARGVNYPGLEVDLLSTLIPPLGTTWRNLAAEELDHSEIGLKLSPTVSTTVDLSLFQDKVSNRYIFGFPPDVPPPPQFINLGAYRMRGAELAVRQQLGRDWSVFSGFTLLDPSINNLPYAPEKALTLGVNGRIGPFSIALDGQYQSEVWALNRARAAAAVNNQRLSAFTVVNARFGYTVPMLGKAGEVFVALENLFDRDYQFRPGYPMAGRSAQLGLAASF
jgi:outer membrane receptor protein involved in Fe transport